MKFLRSVIVVALSVVAWCSASAANPKFDRSAFTSTHYNLQLRIDPAQQRLGIRGTVTLRNDSAQPQSVAALQISSSLNWRSIQMDGQPVPFTSHVYASDIDHTGAITEAVVTLPREIKGHDSIELSVAYEGVIKRDATRLVRIGTPAEIARHNDWDEIGKDFSALRGIGYVAWYPVALESQALAEGDAMFTAIEAWKVRHAASTMRLSIEIDHDGPETVSVLCSGNTVHTVTKGGTNELAGDLCVFDSLNIVPVIVVGNFDLEEGVLAAVYHVTPHSGESLEAANSKSAALVREWFGASRKKVQLIELADPDAVSFEASSFVLLPAHANPQLAGSLLVHQLTHAAVPSKCLWIYEGLASFAQALDHEQRAGRTATLEYLAPQRDAVAAAEKGAHSVLVLAADDAPDDAVHRSKAALVWWMLRDMLGAQALKKAFHEYQAGEDSGPAYLEHLLQAQTSRDLTWFFHDWIDTDSGLPDFHIESANTRNTAGTNYVTAVTVENAGDAGAEVAVILHTEEAAFEQKLEVRAKSKATTRFSTTSAPVEVVVNDGSAPESDVTNNSFRIAAVATEK